MSGPLPQGAPRIGIAIGDPNGVGAEIGLRAALDLHARRGLRSLLIGEDFVIEQACVALGLPASARDAFDLHSTGALARGDWAPGRVDAAAGAATVAYARRAVELLARGEIAAIAAGPHSETAVNAAGISFSGYSGLLADLTGTPRDRVFLMLEARGLRVVHATLHESVAAALARLTPELVEAAAEAARSTLRRMGLDDPGLCVLGINPHAGEGGLFGDEDERITRPAVERMRARGWRVDGPTGADLALSERRHDACVAMLHDQGHIAVKMLSPKGATALVAGLPLLFASVGHGAAFDIAGQGRADAAAMIDTLGLLADAVAAAGAPR
ncbi:MAG: terephthalate dihydrodiol dehydrogenase [Comamonadaceae bacterium]|nr:MAG: terephthalate dihydrodiol dehydrogenase [Comamonadaceae bacterium]